MNNKNTSTNSKILDDAYKNVRMGSYAIDCIVDKIEDQGLKDLLKKQDKFYLENTIMLEDLSKRLGHKPKEIGAMLKASSFSSINLKTLFNKDTSHIAEMLVNGTTMGITTLTKEVNSADADEEVLTLANSIIANQEKFIESLKEFL
ncbi:MAG: hypothetical protein PHX09_03320 [Clostridia bacterium]|nr:hypothetical protein [Clostridia bacterium]MDD4686401.1 hypothetical protein [Clostridia bacterium]